MISNAEIGTWIGATPERLIHVNRDKIETMSLAGTKTEFDNWTKKEYDEQAFVTHQIQKELEKYCHNIQLDGPKTITAGPVQHLQTTIKAQLINPHDWSSLTQGLHPTPAVCGTPTDAARAFILKNEKHDRQFYTGFIGFVQKDTKSLFVNLRCLQFYEKYANLYVGGGIIIDSTQESEWIETERKANTLSALLKS